MLDGKDILWSNVNNFYTDDSSKPIRIASRLTKRHIEMPPFTAMRVKYATQVLSHSVAAGMSLMAQWGIIPAEAQHTAAFIENMDQLFNAFNSMTLKNGARMRHAISDGTVHKAFLQKMLILLKELKTRGLCNYYDRCVSRRIYYPR